MSLADTDTESRRAAHILLDVVMAEAEDGDDPDQTLARLQTAAEAISGISPVAVFGAARFLVSTVVLAYADSSDFDPPLYVFMLRAAVDDHLHD